jgi:8-oxo-dGTP pyrophosphatase MutT (NUDIX family)
MDQGSIEPFSMAGNLTQQSSDPIRRRGAVAVVIRDARFLVIRRSAQVVAPGALCFPGGGIEPGESEEQALVREFQEELGAVIRPVRRIWASVTRWRVELAWWLGELDPGALAQPRGDAGKSEVARQQPRVSAGAGGGRDRARIETLATVIFCGRR